MTRKTVTIAIAAIALLFAACSKAKEQDLPNILFILADDLGYGDLSSYGATAIQTPNIDRLAKEGALFTDAHSPSSVCTVMRRTSRVAGFVEIASWKLSSPT